jgi:hypothetical protein
MKPTLSTVLGILLLGASMTCPAAQGQIDDCEVFAERVTQLVEESFQSRGRIDGREVEMLKRLYPNTQQNHLQFYVAAAALAWATTNGSRPVVLQKITEKCHQIR